MQTSVPRKALSDTPRRKRWTKGDYAVFIILTLTALLILLPFYNAVVISLETNRAYALHPVSLYPAEFSLKNYQYLIDKGQLGIGFQHTILITVSGTALSMAASVMMAYAFSPDPHSPYRRHIFRQRGRVRGFQAPIGQQPLSV